jgi:hypothetical protein
LVYRVLVVNKATLNIENCMDVPILISLIKIRPPHLLPIFYRWSATTNNSRKYGASANVKRLNGTAKTLKDNLVIVCALKCLIQKKYLIDICLSVPRRVARYNFGKKTMFGSSLPPVVCRRDHVLITLYVFAST